MAAARALARIVVLLLLFLTLVPLPLTHAQPQPGGELALVSTEEPDTLDPQKTGTAVTGLLMRYLGDTLLTKDLKGSYIPALARSWSVSGDGLTCTFQLRNDVKFHDGSPFNAQAVKASIERALSPETKSPIAGSLSGPVPDVQAAGHFTVTIKLKYPVAPPLHNLTDPRAMIVSPQAVRDLGDKFCRSSLGIGHIEV